MLASLEFLQQHLASYEETLALDEPDGEVSYGELIVAVRALAIALQEKDPTPGSRVALCAANSLEYLVAVMAIFAAGKQYVPVNCRGDADAAIEILEQTAPSTIIVDDLGDDLIRCDDDYKIHFKQFEGLVRTYRDGCPTTPADPA